jgi:DNA-binding response OmpR family regulator
MLYVCITLLRLRYEKEQNLVVEDDKAIADGIVVNLQYSGYDYRVFANGQDVADSLEADHSYDVIKPIDSI